MTRTQVQLPDPLYRDLKRIASEQDWTLAEVIRRASEHFVTRFPKRDKEAWSFPKPRDLGGDSLIPLENYRAEADAIEDRSR